MELSLTTEQQFAMRMFALELQELDRDELIAALLSEREDLLLQQQYFKGILEDQGLEICPEMDVTLALPETEEDMVRVFGKVPSENELGEYIERQMEAQFEAARIDVDMEAIVLGLEEE